MSPHPMPSNRLPATLLPNQPAAAVGKQKALTEQHLLPALDALSAYLLALRTELDPLLSQQKPVKLGKRYPVGQCLEICKAMQAKWRSGTTQPLPADAAQGRAAFTAFNKAGGSVRQVWGDLRGDYFQNAFQFGDLYVDVANDTVTPTKPKIEILPFAESQLVAISDFRHYAQVASRYWQGEMVPNHILPTLAPYFPWVHIKPWGQGQLCDASDYMLALTTTQQFRPSEAILRDDPMPQALFTRLQEALKTSGLSSMATTPEQGRQAALTACQHYRAKRWHLVPKQRQWAIAQLTLASRALATAATQPIPIGGNFNSP